MKNNKIEFSSRYSMNWNKIDCADPSLLHGANNIVQKFVD